MKPEKNFSIVKSVLLLNPKDHGLSRSRPSSRELWQVVIPVRCYGLPNSESTGVTEKRCFHCRQCCKREHHDKGPKYKRDNACWCSNGKRNQCYDPNSKRHRGLSYKSSDRWSKHAIECPRLPIPRR